MTDEFGKRVYSITKKYEIEDFTYTGPDERQHLLGQEIDVYMNSIGQTITEYLVNFEMFIDLMKEYDFKLTTPELKGKHSGIFDTKDFTYQPGIGGFDQFLGNLGNLASKDTRIKKFHPQALEMLAEDKKGLRELSMLNDWFIFQKV